MNMYDYTWKNGLQFSSRTRFRANRPVTENSVLVDLYDGSRYLVRALYPAKTADKEWDFLPDTVMHTWPAGSLSEHELAELRKRAKYPADGYVTPLDWIVFEPTAA
jgi:hypothetical protein